MVKFCYIRDDQRFSKDSIEKINLIVPNKVIEISFKTFYYNEFSRFHDTEKVKVVTSGDDVFDFKKGILIAIAKWLMPGEYTPEGYEHIAEELGYLKRVDDIVNKEIKKFNREKSEKEKKDKGYADFVARKKAKKAKNDAKKAKRAERLKEDRIKELEEAIRRINNSSTN